MTRAVDYSALKVPDAMSALTLDLLDASAESSQRGDAVELNVFLTLEQLRALDKSVADGTVGPIENAARTGQSIVLKGARWRWSVALNFGIVTKDDGLAELRLKLMLQHDGVLPDESESPEPSGSEPEPELAEDSHPRGPR